MRGRPAHENAQVKRITARPPKQTNPQGRARSNRARRRRSKPTPSLARGKHTESSPEAKTTECTAVSESVQRESEQLANEGTSVNEGWKVVSIYFCVSNGIFGVLKV